MVSCSFLSRRISTSSPALVGKAGVPVAVAAFDLFLKLLAALDGVRAKLTNRVATADFFLSGLSELSVFSSTSTAAGTGFSCDLKTKAYLDVFTVFILQTNEHAGVFTFCVLKTS